MDLVGTAASEMAAAKTAESTRRAAARMPRAKARPAAAAPTSPAAEQIPFEENTGTYGGF